MSLVRLQDWRQLLLNRRLGIARRMAVCRKRHSFVESLLCIVVLLWQITQQECEASESSHTIHRRQAPDLSGIPCLRNDGSSSEIIQFSIREDALPGDRIGVLPLKGEPAGVNATVSLTVTQNQQSQFVLLNVSEKTLLLAQRVDPDTSDQEARLDVQVKCQVLISPFQSISVNYRVSIDIININDNTPEFVGLPYQANLSELTQAGTIIFNSIRAVDMDGTNSNGQVIYSVEYNPNDPEASDYFTIQSGGRGEVSLLQQLDYETKQTWEILIKARDNGNEQVLSNTTMLLINVLDGDDLPPQFLPCNFSRGSTCEPVTYSTTILEKSNVTGPLVFEPGPIGAIDADLDVSSNGPIIYILSTGFPLEYVNYFRMDATTGEVFLIQPVNRADFKEFNLEVTATESDSENRMYVITSATVTIQEVNEHHPVFSESHYQGYVYENSPVGSQVSMSAYSMMPLRLHASDMDVAPGRPLMLSYYLSDATAHFILEPGQDGSFAYVVVSSNRLDRELVNNYTIKALAVENDTFDLLQSVETIVDITVLDENDNAPEFVPNQYSVGENRYRASVEDNAEAGTVIMTLSTTDLDLPPHQPVAFVINYINNDGQTKLGQAQASPSSVNIILKENGTILEGEEYSISMQAVDGGLSSLMSEIVYIEITVLAANVSHAPNFEQQEYKASASEGLPQGAFVTTVTAIDVDEGEVVFYNITDGNIDNVFTVDSASGEVKVVGTLNREVIPSYVLTIQASDGTLSSTCTVLITILDVNDNNPVFNTTLATDFLVLEGLAAEFVGQVMAYDMDEPYTPNSIIQYSLVSDAFRIDPDDGMIFTIDALDREQQDRYELEVIATDMAASPRSTTLQVVVVVQDVNDNGPVFEPKEYSVDIVENQLAQGFLVLEALDRDAVAILEYFITSGDAQTFTIASDSGSLSLLKELDFEATQSYNLEVTVRDTENASVLNSTATVTVNVLDENDHEPVFTRDSYQGAVLRTADLGSIAASGIRATDADRPNTANGQVSYGIIPASVYFTISDPTEGVVFTKTSLQNAPDTHNLTIVAYDNGNPSRSQTASLVILVRMERPVFPQSVYMVDDLKEEEPAGTKVVELQASANQGDQIEYDIISGDPDGKFELVSQDNIGTMTTLKVLDREDVSRYSLMVRASVVEATTGAANRRRRQADTNVVEVVISLVDINDNVPRFEKSAYFIGVSDSAGISTSVITMTAIDLDSQNNSLIDYSMKTVQTTDSSNQVDKPAVDSFTISASTGIIRTAVAELAAEPKIFMYTVFGQERLGPPENIANTTLTISLINEDNRVVLVTNLPPSLLQDNQALLEAALEDILGAEVVIEDVGVRLYGDDLEKSDPSGSDTQFYAINTKTGEPLTTDELIQLLEDFTQLDSVLQGISPDGDGKVIEVRKPRTGRRPLSSDAEPTVEAIALLCLAVALFVLCILAIAVVVVSWKKREMEREKQARLYLPKYNTFNPYSMAEDHEIANPVYLDDHAIPVGAPLFMKPRETQEHTMDFDNEISSDDPIDEATAAANSIAAAVRGGSSRRSSQRSRRSSRSDSRSKTPSSSGPPSYSSNGTINKPHPSPPSSSKIHEVSTIPYRHGETPREPIRPPPLFDPRPTPTSDPRSPFESGSYDNYGADLGDGFSPAGSPISGAQTDSSLSTHKDHWRGVNGTKVYP